jgi:Fic family protein
MSFEAIPSAEENAAKFAKLMMLVINMGSQGEYLHWDKLRFKPMPDFVPEGISLEDYWSAIKISRNATRKFLPFEPKEKSALPFSFCRPDCLLAALRRIDIKAGGTVSTGQDVIGRHDGERYLTRSVIEEPFSSSVLEGAATTRLRAQAMIENDALPVTRDDKMVLNNYKAMQFIKEHVNSELTPAIIFECHRIITEGTLERPEMAGVFRDNNDVIVGDDYGEVFHQPPHFDELQNRLQKLCDFANQDESDEGAYIHPISRAIILHFVLAYDHPFVDGNGRTARALFYWSCLRAGYWMMEYVSISSIIKTAPVQYGRAFLYTETDENDVTYFLMHQLNVIKRAISELEKYLDRQKGKYRAIENLLTGESFNHRQKYLLTEFIRKRVISITIGKHEKDQNVSYLTARKDLDELERSGWLTKEIIGRQHHYKAGLKLSALQGD